MTFGALFRTVATAGGVPPGAELSPAQRLRTIAVAGRRPRSGGSGRCGARPRAPASPAPSCGCSTSCRPPGSTPTRSRPAPRTLEGSAYLSDIATLFAGYAEVRERSGRVDSHGIAREAIELLRRDGSFWGERPGLPLWARRPHSQPVRAGRGAGGADRGDRGAALRGGERGAGGALAPARRAARADRGGRGDGDRGRSRGTPRARCSSTSRAASARPRRRRGSPDGDLLLLRSAGVRGEAEAIATEVSKLVAGGADPAADRDRPARPGAARRGDRGGAGGERRGDGAGGGAAGRRDRRRRRPGGAAGGRVRHPAGR